MNPHRFIGVLTGLILGLGHQTGLSATAYAAAAAEPPGGREPPQAGDAGPAEAPAASVPESACLSDIRQLTSRAMGLQRSGEAYFAPDGRTIIFQAVPPGAVEYQIYTLQLTDEGAAKPESLRMVSTGGGACTCSYFRPDGKRIIFASSHLDPRLSTTPRPAADEAFRTSRGYRWDFNEWMDVFEADPDGGNRTRLTDAKGYDAECAYSPDGKLIVFASARSGDVEIYVMQADGSNVRRITRAAGYDGGPFFAPDGKRVIYRSDRRGDGNMQIFTNNLDGTDEVALTDNPLFNWCPYWHPSGRYLIFTQADHRGRPNYDLVLLAADGSRPTRITQSPKFDGLPVFSPDGRRLMWTSGRGADESSQVFLAEFRPPDGF